MKRSLEDMEALKKSSNIWDIVFNGERGSKKFLVKIIKNIFSFCTGWDSILLF